MRVRVRFSKLGKVRFTSHRDVARMWERSLRRVQLPVAWSAGFSPRPRLHFGLALSTGHESLAEYLDIDLVPADGEPVDVDALPELISPTLPVGLDVAAAALVATGTDSLQAAVTSSSWRLTVPETGVRELRTAVERLLAADEIVVTRQRKGQDVTDDLRPYVLDLTVVGPSADGVELACELGTQPRGLRPAELIAALGGFTDGRALVEGRVCRTHQWMQHDGARQEPLPLAATSAPHAEARAS